MRLLFENLAEKHFTKERIQKFQDWIENANKAREADSLDKEANQYDKAEELITFYTFAPLELRKDNNVVQEILKLANIYESVKGKVKLSFEKQLRPPKGYLKWLTTELEKHPIRYIREQGKEHIKTEKPLETNTHVDVIIETKDLLILFEVKFTSDISSQTMFGLNRNQLARTIDVGISKAKKEGKKLIVLLCTPSEVFNKRNRLFYYKIQEYSDFSKIQEDILWRKLEEIKDNLVKVSWIPLEDVIQIVHQNISSHDLDEARNFFEERKLIREK